jgi:hypothetical protein
MIASIVRRRSDGSVLPRGRTASIIGASRAHWLFVRTPYGFVLSMTPKMGRHFKV